MLDTAWSGLSPTEGEPLFDAQGRPAPALQQHLALLERFEAEAQRTRFFNGVAAVLESDELGLEGCVIDDLHFALTGRCEACRSAGETGWILGTDSR